MTDNETIFKSQGAHYHTHDKLSYRLYKKDKNNELQKDNR